LSARCQSKHKLVVGDGIDSCIGPNLYNMLCSTNLHYLADENFNTDRSQVVVQRHTDITQVCLIITHANSVKGLSVYNGDLNVLIGTELANFFCAPIAIHSPAKPAPNTTLPFI
jgi:hypothetical protein